MKANKIEICMKGAEAVKNCARNIGMVCKNCEFYQRFTITPDWCKALETDVRIDGFCYLFTFRDEEACQEFWDMCVERVNEDPAER